MLNKLMTGWTNYVAFVKENHAECKESSARSLLEHRVNRRASEEYNSIMRRSISIEDMNPRRANELKQEAQRLKDSYKNRKF